MTSPRLVRVLAHGGVISPADLTEVIRASRAAGNDHVMVGSRQDLLIPVVAGNSEGSCRDILSETDLVWDSVSLLELREVGQRHNVVSSCMAANVTDTTWWLTEDVYQRILDALGCGPRLKIDLVDPRQALVPLFMGDVNFVAAREEQRWHVFLRWREGDCEVKRWPRMISTENLAPVARRISVDWARSPDVGPEELYARLLMGLPGDAIEAAGEEPIPPLVECAPYYEGLNPMAGDLFWLGIYRRNNRFDVDLLAGVCHLCQETRVGKIGITPWKSLLIKGIRERDRSRWVQLTRRHGVNLRHSSLELSWHLPVMDVEALELKSALVRELDRHDVGVQGLTFGVRTRHGAPRFTTIVIDQGRSLETETARYGVHCADGFDPTGARYRTCVADVGRDELVNCLTKLIREYAGQTVPSDRPRMRLNEEEGPVVDERTTHYCGDCMTVYAEEFGDPFSEVPPGTPFDVLPPSYVCSVCAAGKERFSAQVVK